MPHPLSTICNLYYQNSIAFLPLYSQTRSLSSKRQEPTENILTSNHLNIILTPAKARRKHFLSSAVWTGDLQIKSLRAMPVYVQYGRGKTNYFSLVIKVKSSKKKKKQTGMVLPVWPLLCLIPHLTLFICKSISQCTWVMACQ